MDSALEARGPSDHLTDEKAVGSGARALVDRLQGAIDAAIRSPARPG